MRRAACDGRRGELDGRRVELERRRRRRRRRRGWKRRLAGGVRRAADSLGFQAISRGDGADRQPDERGEGRARAAPFYDPILASDNQVACATCHSEFWGLGDALPLSVGVDGVGPAGPGRMGPNVTTRNALTLWNAAFRTELFWDGRSPSLELQALQPMKHPNEMDQPASKAAVRVAAVDAYATLFEAAFPGDSTPVTATNITRALASFERTFVTNHAPYDQYVAGDVGAMADDEKRGMRVFASENCASCHAPPLFEGARYENRIGGDDPGRFAITGDAADQGAFRVPTLRNARETGPYFLRRLGDGPRDGRRARGPA